MNISRGAGAVYPPRPNDNASSQQTLAHPGWTYDQSTSDVEHRADTSRPGARTPSPTPSEAKELSRTGAFDWDSLKNWRFWIRKEWTWYYLLCIIIVTVVALVTLFHEQIVTFLKPAANWMHGLKFGLLIPIAILFIISFPPLFGHEIIAILCGLVWGLWVGFGIVAAGTFLGEVGNFYAFKWCCHSRGEKLERTNLFYACLARVVRDGGFKIALIARLSAIPGHFTTAIFSTCGMGIIVFSIAAVLSLPKQFITVYLGVILEQSADGTQVSKKDNIIKYVVLVVTTLITVWALWYMYHEMGKVKVQVIYDRRKARQAKLTSGSSPYTNFEDISSTVALNPTHAYQVDPNPMNKTQFNPHANFNPDTSSEPYQRWDENGKAVGWAGDPNLVFAPQPSRAVGYTSDAPLGRSDIVPPQAQGRLSEEDVGYQYPMSELGRDGRVVIRQQSDDSVYSVTRQGAASEVGVPRAAYSPPPADQTGVQRRTNKISAQTQSSESQYSQDTPQLPSMQLTQSDPLPSLSPVTPSFSRPMASSISVPTSSSTIQYQYQPPPLPSMSPTLQHHQPYDGYHPSSPGGAVDNRRVYSPQPPSYHTDVNLR